MANFCRVKESHESRRNTPLPPVSRMEDKTDLKRCVRLRYVLCNAINALTQGSRNAQHILSPVASRQDLEKYYNICEIEENDVACITQEPTSNTPMLQPLDSLHQIRAGIGRLHIARKLVLCTLLALEAGRGKEDLRVWAMASDEMMALSVENSCCAEKLQQAFADEMGMICILM